MNIKDDKSLWEPMQLEGVGKVLLVEDSYYDGIVEHVQGLNNEINFLRNEIKELEDNLDFYRSKFHENNEKISRLEEYVEYWRTNYYVKENLLNEAQELIKLLYNNMGGSADSDHALWMKTKEYCFKNKLISYEK
jgi:chromosome segregation ATPase